MDHSNYSRLFVGSADCTIIINDNNSRLYCHHLSDEEENYHRISLKELYVQHDTLAFCFDCAIQRGILAIDKPELREKPIELVNALRPNTMNRKSLDHYVLSPIDKQAHS